MPADTSFDEIHQICIRMGQLAERLLDHPRFHVVETDPTAGELLVRVHPIAAEAAKLKALTRRLPWPVEEVWREVLRQKSI